VIVQVRLACTLVPLQVFVWAKSPDVLIA